jgi:hypothetical protein
MKISYNFASLVALGNFNPAIMTSDFLNRVCKLDLGDVSEETPAVIPVVRRIKFSRLEIDVDLKKFQIKNTGIDQKADPQLTKIFRAYYQKLPYTPISAVGVNINCNLLPELQNESKSIEKKLSNPATYLEFFNVSQVLVREEFLSMKSDKTWIGGNYRIEKENDLTCQIDTSRKGEVLSLNYNWEASDLARSEERRNTVLGKLFDGYEEFRGEFLKFIEALGGKS